MKRVTPHLPQLNRREILRAEAGIWHPIQDGAATQRAALRL